MPTIGDVRNLALEVDQIEELYEGNNLNEDVILLAQGFLELERTAFAEILVQDLQALNRGEEIPPEPLPDGTELSPEVEALFEEALQLLGPFLVD